MDHINDNFIIPSEVVAARAAAGEGVREGDVQVVADTLIDLAGIQAAVGNEIRFGKKVRDPDSGLFKTEYTPVGCSKGDNKVYLNDQGLDLTPKHTPERKIAVLDLMADKIVESLSPKSAKDFAYDELRRCCSTLLALNLQDSFKMRANPKHNEILLQWLTSAEALTKAEAAFRTCFPHYSSFPSEVNPLSCYVSAKVENGYVIYRFAFGIG